MQINKRSFAEPDRQRVQESVIAQVKADPERFIQAYKDDPRSFGGRYVSADLMKEKFSAFNASPEARNRYNAPVHNAAAALSAELYERAIRDDSDPSRSKAYFVTGIPGAGKTTAILRDGELPRTARVVFEGQLSNPASGIEKMRSAMDQGLGVTIRAVHREPEAALDNTVRRFNDYGRGASISLMADIQGNLPDGLQEIRKQFGDRVRLDVLNYRTARELSHEGGWEKVDPILGKEGDRDAIHGRLERRLDALRERGDLSPAAEAQAYGKVLDREAERDRGRGSGADDPAREQPGGRSRSAVGAPQESLLTPPEQETPAMATKSQQPAREAPETKAPPPPSSAAPATKAAADRTAAEHAATAATLKAAREATKLLTNLESIAKAQKMVQELERQSQGRAEQATAATGAVKPPAAPSEPQKRPEPQEHTRTADDRQAAERNRMAEEARKNQERQSRERDQNASAPDKDNRGRDRDR